MLEPPAAIADQRPARLRAVVYRRLAHCHRGNVAAPPHRDSLAQRDQSPRRSADTRRDSRGCDFGRALLVLGTSTTVSQPPASAERIRIASPACSGVSTSVTNRSPFKFTTYPFARLPDCKQLSANCG